MAASGEVLPQSSPSSDECRKTPVFDSFLNEQTIRKEQKTAIKVLGHCLWVMVFKVILLVQFLLIQLNKTCLQTNIMNISLTTIKDDWNLKTQESCSWYSIFCKLVSKWDSFKLPPPSLLIHTAPPPLVSLYRYFSWKCVLLKFSAVISFHSFLTSTCCLNPFHCLNVWVPMLFHYLSLHFLFANLRHSNPTM